jgi:uncharacterized protein DUF5715
VKSRIQRAILLPLLLALAVCSHAFGLHRYVAPRRSQRAPAHRAHTRRLRWNPVFRPSRDSLLRQNEEIDRLELPRIQDDRELEQLKANEELVPINPSRSLRIASTLEPSRRYCRPWTREFLNDLSEDYYQEFQSQIQVNSAVRTVKVQRKLRRHNRNAAPEKGELASSHLAGVTIDIQRRGMSRQQIAWVEQYMLPLKDLGIIEPEEERHQVVFHVMVSDRYTDWREAKMLAGEQQNEEKSDTRTRDEVSTRREAH